MRNLSSSTSSGNIFGKKSNVVINNSNINSNSNNNYNTSTVFKRTSSVTTMRY